MKRLAIVHVYIVLAFLVLYSTSLFAHAALGELRIATILVTFQNDIANTAYLGADRPLTPELCRSFLFESEESVNVFFQENSYGKLSVTGDVFGPYVIPVDAPSAENDSSCMCLDEVIAVADADIHFDEYDIITIIYPRSRDENGGFVNYCGFQGAGTQKLISSEEGDFNKTAFWINGFLDLHIVAHELGHYLELDHANKKTCRNCYDYKSDCTTRNTQDPFDAMGYSTAPGYRAPGHFSAFNKATLGWLDEENIFSIEQPNTYDVTLTALEENSGGIKLLTLPFSTSRNYCVEFRQNIGFDKYLSPLNGLLFRIASSRGMNGQTEIIEPLCDSGELVLRTGQVFRDKNLPLQVEVLEQAGDSINIRVIYDAINIRGSLVDNGVPQSLSMGDSLVIPFMLYNDSQTTITDSIYLQVESTKLPRSTAYDTVLITDNFSKNDSMLSSYMFSPERGCGDYTLKMFLASPKTYPERYVDDNYLTDKNEGEAINVLCDGPELYGSITATPMIFEPGEPVDILFNIENVGEKDSGPFSALVKNDNQELIYHFDNIAAGENASRRLHYSYECGAYRIVLWIDKENKVFVNNKNGHITIHNVWANQPCDAYLVKLYLGLTNSNFCINDSMIFCRYSQKEFFFYSLIENRLRVVSPQLSGTFSSSCDATNEYCVLIENTGNDSTVLNLHNLRTGDVKIIPPEQSYQYNPRINDSWLIWIEGVSRESNRSLYALNLSSGERKLIDSEVVRSSNVAELTKTNLLYWRSLHRGVMVCDLEREAEPLKLPFEGSFSTMKFKGDTIVALESQSGEYSLVWRKYDAENGTASPVLHEYSHDSIQKFASILDFNKEYLIYRVWGTSSIHLYSIAEDRNRCISDIIGRLSTAYLREDEIIGIFSHPWEHFIGAAKISDLLNVPVSVEEKEEHVAATYFAAPNPFNSRTTIRFSLPTAANIELAIFNTMGQQVRMYAYGMLDSGSHSLVWDGFGENGAPLASGVYFCVLQVDGEFSAKPLKVLLIK
jgi:M6 family metalloprotease-like protein